MAAAKRLLVIDDDGDFRVSIRLEAERAGYAVIEASSGEEGLRKLVERRPDVVVLDIMMEDLEEGYRVNEAIRYEKEF